MRLITYKDLRPLKGIPFSREHLRRLEADGKFPKRVRLAEGGDYYGYVEEEMIEDLIARDIIFIENVEAIEDKYFLSLAHVLAGFALSEFGIQNDPALTARAIKAQMDLNEIDRNSVRYLHMRTMRSDYPGVRPLVDASTLF